VKPIKLPAAKAGPAQLALPAALEKTVNADSTLALPPLPGIDVLAGMAVCTHNESLYLRMLIKFRERHGGFGDLFAAAQVDPDCHAAARAAHTLKGTAGNIGAKGVQAAAGELERASLEKPPLITLDALLANTLAELAIVMSGLQALQFVVHPVADKPLASGRIDATGRAPMSESDLKSYFDKLKGLLQESEAEAKDLLSELLSTLGASPLALALRPVAEAIADFDFDEALLRLEQVDLA
jgi:HPt (histidine-containing phosphotransfer) domain-containing protein